MARESQARGAPGGLARLLAALLIPALQATASAAAPAQSEPASDPPAQAGETAPEDSTPASISLEFFGLDLDRLNTLEVETAARPETPGTARPSEAAVADAERAIEERAEVARAAEAARSAGRQATPAAVAFSRRLQEAIELELKAQTLERNTLGLERFDSVGGIRRERWLRIERERDARTVTAGLTIAPLYVPRPDDAASRPREVLIALGRLERAHETARDLRPLNTWIELNGNFLRTNDFARRDGAVAVRDEVLEREAQYARLMTDALELISGNSLELAADIEERLDTLAPASARADADLAVMVLRDEELRQQSQSQVMALLSVAPPRAEPPASAAELTQRITQLQAALLEAAELPPLLAEHERLKAQLEALDVQLRSSLPADRRQDLVAMRIGMLTRSHAIEEHWLTTPPDPELWAQLVSAQDELLRRHQLDSGARAAILAGRVDALEATRPADAEDPSAQWRFLEDQREVIALHEAVRPSNDPLEGVTLPDTYGLMLLKDAKAKLAAQNQAAAKIAAAAAMSKPVKPGKKGQKAAPMPVKPKPQAAPKPAPKKPAAAPAPAAPAPRS